VLTLSNSWTSEEEDGYHLPTAIVSKQILKVILIVISHKTATKATYVPTYTSETHVQLPHILIQDDGKAHILMNGTCKLP